MISLVDPIASKVPTLDSSAATHASLE